MNLNQVTIPSLNLARAVEFYQTLGLQLIVDAMPRYVRFECPDGDATFSIHLIENLPEGNRAILYFENENLDKVVEQLIAQGIEFKEMPNDKSWLWREAHLEDPDGNYLILYHAGENRKNPPWRI